MGDTGRKRINRILLLLALVLTVRVFVKPMSASQTSAKSFVLGTALSDMGTLVLQGTEGSELPAPRVENGVSVYYVKENLRYAFSLKEDVNENVAVSIAEKQEDGVTLSDTATVGKPQISGSLKKDGAYELQVVGTDEAGNRDAKTFHIVVDKTEPVLSFERIVGDSVYRNSQLLQINMKEAYPDYDKSEVSITKKESGKENVRRYTWNEIKNALDKGSGALDTKAFHFEFLKKADDMNVLWIRFSEEVANADYTVVVTAKDKAGNEAKKKTIHFGMDSIAPIVEVFGCKMDECYNRPVTIVAAIDESNISSVKAKVIMTRTVDGTVVEEEKEENLTIQNSAVSKSFKEEGDYEIRFHITDAAGNEAICGERTDLSKGALKDYVIRFSIDTTPPKLSISGVKEGAAGKKDVSLTYKVKEKNHDISKYRISVTKRGKDGWEEAYMESFDEVEESAETLTKTAKFTREGAYTVKFEAEDKVGNVSTLVRTFYIDRSAPVISALTYKDSKGTIVPVYRNICSSDVVKLIFRVRDGITEADPNKVYVTVGKENRRYPAKHLSGSQYEIDIPDDIARSEFDGVLTIWASDILGNRTSKVSNPIIFSKKHSSIFVDSNVDLAKWTNRDVVLHTRVRDDKSGISKVYVILRKGTDIKIHSMSFDKLVREYKYDVLLTDNAETVEGYTVEIEAVNNCGVITNKACQILIDKNEPTVSLSGIENDRNYRQDVSFEMKVEDTSYNQTVTSLVVERTVDGVTSRVDMPAHASVSYADTVPYTVKEDGTYKIYAVSRDGAGNRAVSNTLQFVIDRTPPKFNITGVDNGGVVAGAANLTFACEESNYQTAKATIRVERTSNGSTTSFDLGEIPKSGRVSTLSHSFTEDGHYTITMNGTDAAGNVAEQRTVSFVIDRTKPVLSIEGTKNYEMWDGAVTLSVTVNEENYSDNNVSVTGSRTDIDGNEEAVSLPQFVGSSRVSANSYRFDKDGHYSFVVRAKDRAGNADEQEIHFTVDRTPPVLSGLEQFDGGYLKEFRLAQSMDSIISDLTVVSYRILLNGVEYNGTDTVTDEGKYNLSIEVSDELNHVVNESIEFIIDHTAPRIIFTGVGDGTLVRDKGAVGISLADEEDEITAIRMNGKTVDKSLRELRYSQYGTYEIEVDCRDKAGNDATRTLKFTYVNPTTVVAIVVSASILTMLLGAWMMLVRRRRG